MSNVYRFIFLLHKYGKSFKKAIYMANTNRSKLLDSYFYDTQTWRVLHKAWKGYVIAKNKRVFIVRDHGFMYVP
jgi:hypothetical protein